MMDIWEAEPRLASQELRPAGLMIGRTQSRVEVRSGNPLLRGNALQKEALTARVSVEVRKIRAALTYLRGETIAIRQIVCW